MEIRHIQEFLTLSHCLNFSETAEKMYTTQSAISKHITLLEKELGCKLFIRTSRKTTLTECGEAFQFYANIITTTYDQSLVAIQEYMNQSSSTLTLGIDHKVHANTFDKFVMGFTALHPDCAINIIEEDDTKLRQMAAAHQFSLFTAFAPETPDPDFAFVPIARDHIVALIPKNHKLNTGNPIHLRELRAENLILPPRDTTPSKLIKEAFAKKELSPRIVYEGTSEGNPRLVSNGFGIALQFNTRTTDDYSDDVVVANLEPEIPYVYGISYAKFNLSSIEQEYVNYVRDFLLDELAEDI